MNCLLILLLFMKFYETFMEPMKRKLEQIEHEEVHSLWIEYKNGGVQNCGEN